MESSKIVVCPICLGSRIDLYLGGYAGKIYRCLDCGYVGSIILEMELEEYMKILEKKRLEDEEVQE
ncbi:MAG: TFIIB-type zinc ribbon-containing protein [Thermoprotei archaeon]|nr:MAG: TFIIB-type zinc ribbon-containing protein [Thermoprotei archaeon]